MVFLPDKNTTRYIALLYRKTGKSKATDPTCNKLQEKNNFESRYCAKASCNEVLPHNMIANYNDTRGPGHKIRARVPALAAPAASGRPLLPSPITILCFYYFGSLAWFPSKAQIWAIRIHN